MKNSVKSVENKKIEYSKEQQGDGNSERSWCHGVGKRDSNFELLRIVAMFMIIVFHIVFHCVIEQMTGGNDAIQLTNTVFNEPLFYKKLFLLNMITPLGYIANAIFLLISGYFMLSKGRQIHIFKIAKKLLLQLVFATVTLVLVSAWVCHRCKGGGAVSPL